MTVLKTDISGMLKEKTMIYAHMKVLEKGLNAELLEIPQLHSTQKCGNYQCMFVLLLSLCTQLIAG